MSDLTPCNRTRASELGATVYDDPVDGRTILTAPAGRVWASNLRHTLDVVAIGEHARAAAIESLLERIREPKPLVYCEADQREDCEECLEASDFQQGATS